MPARATSELSIGFPDEPLLVAREALSEGDAVSFKSGDTNELDYSSRTGDPQEFGFDYTTDFVRLAQKVSFSSQKTIGALTVRILKYGSSTDSIRVGIQADSIGSPSGTFLASFTKAASAFTSDAAFKENLGTAVTLSANTTYWIVFERTGAIDATNYYQTQASGGFPSGQEVKRYDGTSWLDATNGLYVVLWSSAVEGVFKAKATNTAEAAVYLGIMDTTVFSGANLPAGAIITHGLKKKTGWGLTKGAVYYLSDTAGVISTSAGTISKKIGLSLGSGTLILFNTL